MSDLVDLVTPEGSHVQPRRHRWMRLLALLLFVLVLTGLVGGAMVGARVFLNGRSTPDYVGQGTGEVVVQVLTGQTSSDIGVTLSSKGVVKSERAFRKAADADPRSRSVQPGFYRLRSHMSAADAVALLVDPQARLLSRVTLPEGLPLTEALQKIATSTQIPLADLQKAVADPAALGLPAYANGQVEGFLFPATYQIQPGTSAVGALRMMIARYVQAEADLNLDMRAAAIGQTPYQVLVIASLIEKETAYGPDRAKVARVIDNRLAVGKNLELDSTVNYSRANKTARLTDADLTVESPYNTYLHKGLPPTPIDAPGEAAIDAALAPADGNWIYFVTVSKDGSALFTNDYAAFEAAKTKSQADGVY